MSEKTHEVVNGWHLCGPPPTPGNVVWNPAGERFVYQEDGTWLKIPTPEIKVSKGERIAAFFMCPACFLPRFVPGHKIRGCEG